MSYVCHRCHRYPLEDHIWWSMERSSATGGVRHVAASIIGRTRTESWSHKTPGTAEKHKCFEHMRRHKESVTI